MKTDTSPQYMFLVRGSCKDAHTPGDDRSAEELQTHMTEVFAWIEKLTQQGIFTAAQPLTSESKLVSGGTVTDGVFAESKEAVGGFFIVNVPTMEEAVKIASESPMVKHGGMLEVRQIAELKCE
jgi:hypothetical protein